MAAVAALEGGDLDPSEPLGADVGVAAVGGRPWNDLDPEVAGVLQHRFERFRKLGFNRKDAEILACSEADLHDAEHLIRDLGCPLHYALLILA